MTTSTKSNTRHLLIEAMDHWKNAWGAMPDDLSWSADKPNVIWLCSGWTRLQVVLDRDVTRDQVQRAQTSLRNGGYLFWHELDSERAN